MDEKIIRNSPGYISISCVETILNQMRNSICKIRINQTNGTGFFCKIPYENNTMNVLMTNYHVLDEEYYNKNDELNLFINDEEEVKRINLKTERKKYFNKEYDLALIELKEDDRIPINNYFELDDNLFKDEIDAYYQDISIYVLQYPLGNNAAVSYGLSNGINTNCEIIHTCSTEHGSSGSPILNLSNNKVIGIHKQGSINFNYNIGTCLQFPLNDFFEKIKNENDPNNINNAILNECLEKSDEFYEKAKNYMNDMMYHIEHRQVMYITLFEFAPIGFRDLAFLYSPYHCSNILFKFGTTVDDMLKIYSKIKGIDNESTLNFSFVMFGKKLEFGDTTPIEIFFNNALNLMVDANLNNIYTFIKYKKFSIEEVDEALLIIYFNQVFYEKNMVNKIFIDYNNIKSFTIDNDILNKCLKMRTRFYERLNYEINKKINEPLINVIFQINGLINKKFSFNYGTTIEQMLKIYLGRFYFGGDIMDNKDSYISFLFNDTRLELGDKTPIENFFNNEAEPKVIVNISNDVFIQNNDQENELLKLYGKQIREEIYGPDPEPDPKPEQEQIHRQPREINIKFNKEGNIVNIKMHDFSMVAELINEYFVITNTYVGTFKFNELQLFPMDAASLYEVGLKNNSEIIVQ